ncbi:Ger(x)C family spore germination protein [Bacillus sp. FJAT-49736]|uniref:Ger(x)C family spore germination protein n=1 Tax=Bacillus sp. FJAT-49736 TaxID=2833582 RepID=UPI001BC937E9|nr:Ger(x)C family spore germination protein [Bacillus sp. FJAT-49736]MBS4175144.1 Ger(x)C family spore germination protein [Bacillus sp. FJAT-49736]
MNRKWLLLLVIVFVIFIGGCGFKDIDKRFFVVSIGVDKGATKRYKVSVELVLPSGDPKAPGDSTIFSEEGDSVAEAIGIIKANADKELDFGHMKVIIIGNEVAKQNLFTTLDWFSRRRDIQEIAWVSLSDSTAREILEYHPKGEYIPSNNLLLLFGNEGTETPYIISEYLFSFWRDLVEPGIDPVLPIIKYIKEENTLEIQRSGVIRNKRLSLILDNDDTMLLNLFVKQKVKSEINVKSKKYDFTIASSKAKVKYKIRTNHQDSPIIDIMVSLKGNLEEKHREHQKVNLNEYEKITNQHYKKKFESLLKKLQKAKVDPIGFGQRYEATHIGAEDVKIKKWQKLYPKAKFRVKVTTKIDGTGIIK